MATIDLLLRVLKAMDTGAFELLLERYGGMGYVTSNEYRYQLSKWYVEALDANPTFFAAHNDATVTTGPQTTKIVCECGTEYNFPNEKISKLGMDEFYVFHQIDFAWQDMPPKNRPQWWKFQ